MLRGCVRVSNQGQLHVGLHCDLSHSSGPSVILSPMCGISPASSKEGTRALVSGNPQYWTLVDKDTPPPLVALPPFQSSTKMWAAVTLLALDFCGAHPLGLPFSSMIGTIRVS